MTSGKVAFKNRDELAKAFKALATTSVGKRKDIETLAASTSILDILESLRDTKTQQDFDKLVAQHKEFFQLVQDKTSASKLAHLKSNPLLACVTDETGTVRVGDDVYDVSEERAIRSLVKLLPEQTERPTMGGGVPGAQSLIFIP